MIPDSIERDVLIEAPVDVVWRVVTEPDQITRWFSDRAELDLQAIAWSEAEKAKYYDSHSGGWDAHTADLVDYVAGRARAAGAR